MEVRRERAGPIVVYILCLDVVAVAAFGTVTDPQVVDLSRILAAVDLESVGAQQ